MDWRAHVRTTLDGDHPVFGRGIVFVLYGLIGLSAISIGIETIPGLPTWAGKLLAAGEVVTVLVFTVEYGLRIAIAPKPLAYMRSFFGIVDLLAILPFYLSLGIDLRALRAFRLFRLLPPVQDRALQQCAPPARPRRPHGARPS